MTYTSNVSKHIYYSNEHEWVDYKKCYAYVGVSDFKLIGVGTILRIKLNTLSLNLNRGQSLGSIISKDYEIPFCMPITGKLVDYNEYLLANPTLLADKSISNRWLIKILPYSNTPDETLIRHDMYIKQINRYAS